MGPAHLKKFDVVRGLAAMVVLCGHVIEVYVVRLTGHDRRFVHLAELMARHAVLVFFLLSGYLITASILNNIGRNGRFDALQYLSSRISRIYPPLCGAILLVLVAWALIQVLGTAGSAHYGLPGDAFLSPGRFSVSVGDIGRALLMQGGLLVVDGPLWSLYTQFHIYLLAMLGALAYCARGAVRYTWLGVGLVLFVIWAYLWIWFIFFVLVWSLGAAVAIADSGIRPAWGAVRFTSSAARVAGIALAAWVAVAPNYDAFVVDRFPLWRGFVVQALFSVCYAHLLFRSRYFGWVIPRALAKSGDFSYSLYVVHVPLLLLGRSLAQNWMGDSLGRTWVVAIAMIPVTLCMARYFACYFEDQKRLRGVIYNVLAGMRTALMGRRLAVSAAARGGAL